jgi:hypothetical protein
MTSCWYIERARKTENTVRALSTDSKYGGNLVTIRYSEKTWSGHRKTKYLPFPVYLTS